MGQMFAFLIFAFFTGVLGLVIGGPFRVLVVENDNWHPVSRAIFGIIFFPPVAGVVGLVMYYLLSEKPMLGPVHWGIMVGLISGMSYSYRLSGKINDAKR